MQRNLSAWARRLAVTAGVGALVLTATHLAAQPRGLGSLGQAPASASTEDEIWPRLVLGPRGDVLRFWLRVDNMKGTRGAMLLAAARPANAWETLFESRPAEPGTSFRDPYLAVAPSNEFAVLYQRIRRTGAKQVELARSDDGGKTWTAPAILTETASNAFEPKAAWARDGSLVVVWSYELRGRRLFDVYARRSPDGGKSWEPERLLSRFSRQLPGDLYARPILLGDGQDRLWAVWVGIRAERSALYLTRSTDAGRTWTDPESVTGDSESVFGHQLLRAGKHMVLLWQDMRTGRDRAYAVSSTDEGVTWTSPVRVDHLPGDSPVQVTSLTGLLTADGEVLAAWHDERNGRADVFLARSTDGGRSWGTADQRMDMDEPGTAISREPALARAADGRVALAWEDDRAGHEAVYLRIRSAGGPRDPDWGPEIRVASPGPKRGMRLPQLLWGPDGPLQVAWEVWDFTAGPANPSKRIESRALQPDKP